MNRHSLKYYDPWGFLDNSRYFDMLNTNEVFERFADLTDAYRNKLLCAAYTWPEYLWDEYFFTQDKLNSANIDRIIHRCLKKFANIGIEISYEDIKPLIEDLKFGDSRVLIVETAKAFIQFATSDRIGRSKIRRQFIYFEIIPKLEDLTPLYFMGA